jgi:hypothetical protein
MALWLMLLPFAFLPTMGLWTIALCIIVGYQILGFEDIGVEIESPFGYDYNDLPVDQLQAQIFNNLLQCLKAISADQETVLRTMKRMDSKGRTRDGLDGDDVADAGEAGGAAAGGGGGGGGGGGADTAE